MIYQLHPKSVQTGSDHCFLYSSPAQKTVSQSLEASANKTNVIFNRVAHFLWSLQSTDYWYVGNYISHLDSKLQEHFKVVHSFLSRNQGTFGSRKYSVLRLDLTLATWGICACTCMHGCTQKTEFILTVRSQKINKTILLIYHLLL